MNKYSEKNKKTYEWIVKVVDSCETFDQLETAKNLVNNFYEIIKLQNFNGYSIFIKPLLKLCRKKAIQLS